MQLIQTNAYLRRYTQWFDHISPTYHPLITHLKYANGMRKYTRKYAIALYSDNIVALRGQYEQPITDERNIGFLT